jgi:PAS domain S-box-containing protein
VLGVGQDITERKKVEMEKTRVAQELQTFIDTANAPIFGIDHNGMVNEWNNKSVEITGYTREEVMGKSLVDVYISEDFRESVKSVFDDALDGKGTANFEFPIFTVDKRRVEVLLNATTRCNVKGEVLDPDSLSLPGPSVPDLSVQIFVPQLRMVLTKNRTPESILECCRSEDPDVVLMTRLSACWVSAKTSPSARRSRWRRRESPRSCRPSSTPPTRPSSALISTAW